MEINGNIAFLGFLNFIREISYNDADDLGDGGLQKQGYIKFNNGLKIQWNTITVPQNSEANYDLVDTYTADHYTCFTEYAGDIVITETDQDTMSWVPSIASGNSLTQITIRQHANTPRAVTWVSIGRDIV